MIAFLLLSVIGWHVFCARRTHWPMAVIPLTLVSATVTAGYLSALVGFLRPAIWAMAVGGIACGLWAVSRRPVVERRLLAWLPQVFFVLCGCFIVWLMQGAAVTDFDDFSHWYRICKIMHADGGLPATPDLSFRSYVPGTALWVTAVTQFTDFNPANCFAAHRLIGVAALCVLFLPLELRRVGWRVALGLFVIVVVLAVIAGKGGFYNLLVDKTVALVAAAALCLMTVERRDGAVGVPLFLILSFLALTKCSALLFVVILGGSRMMLAIRDRASSREAVRASLYVLIPCVLWGLYAIYARLTFPGRHGMGSHVFPNVPAWFDRSSLIGECLGPLSRHFAAAISDWSSVEVRMVGMGLAAALIGLLVLRGRRWFALALVCSVCWIGGQFLTYLLEMTPGEIDVLASFSRYLGTLALFLTVVCSFCLLRNLLEEPCGWFCRAMSGFLLVALIGGAAVGGSYAYLRGYKAGKEDRYCSDVLWRSLQASIPERWSFSDEERVVVYDKRILSRPSDTRIRILHGCTIWMRTPEARIRLYEAQELQDSPQLREEIERHTKKIVLKEPVREP